ncbi:MAG: beta-agarase, partial [Planctomycetota bacterium]
MKGLRVLPFSPDGNAAISTRQPEVYRIQMPSMPLPKNGLERMRIRAEIREGETVTVDSVALNSQGKLLSTFDEISYSTLGVNSPRKCIEARVLIDQEHSIGGTTDLQRSKFFRYYASPGGVHSTFQRWAAERNFLPGRQIFKLQPGLVVGYSRNQPKLKERTDKPGHADLSFFQRYETNGGHTNAIEAFRGIDFAMCFNDYPEFMSRHPNGRGTPNVQHFDAAAELAAAYVKNQQRGQGRTATHWELKNESTIKPEWDYHYLKEYDSWGLLAQFHNTVSDAIHQRSPQTRVGGPTSAWMQVQVGDFKLYRNQQRFMDETRGHLDFYSHHFYEDRGSLGAYARRGDGYTNYLLGRFEAILDMFVSHMHQTDNVRPIVISECGSLQPGRSPANNWLRLRSYNAFLMKAMQRPQQIDLLVPFIFLQIPWNPSSGDSGFEALPGKRANGPIQDFRPLIVSKFFDLWRDFDGTRIPVLVDEPFVDMVAVKRGSTVRVAMLNMGGQRLLVDLSSL